jgi:hypothetical protein
MQNNQIEEQDNPLINEAIPLVTLENIDSINIDNPIFTDDIKNKINGIIVKMNRYRYGGAIRLDRMGNHMVEEIKSTLNEINFFLENNKVLNVNDILKKQELEPQYSRYNRYVRFPILQAKTSIKGGIRKGIEMLMPNLNEINRKVRANMEVKARQKGGKYTKKRKTKKRNTKKRYSSLKL